jgi:hypothetical protein
MSNSTAVPRTPIAASDLAVICDFEQTTQANLAAKLADHDTALDAQVTDAVVSPAITTPANRKVISIAIPDAATATYAFVVSDKVQIVDVTVLKSGAGAGNTIQVQDGAGDNISDAIAAAVDKTVTRAGTLDPAHSTIAAAGSIKVVATRAAGSMLCQVVIEVIERA